MRGEVQDIIVITVFICITSLALFVSYLATDQFTKTQINDTPQAADILLQGKQSLVIMGNSLLFIVVAFAMLSVIGAYYTETHPVFFVFSLLVFSVSFIISWIFSSIFIELAATSSLLPIANEFANVILLMQQMPILTAILGILIIMGLYLKRDGLSQLRGGMA